jgi:GDP-D-mannose dehydratase
MLQQDRADDYVIPAEVSQLIADSSKARRAELAKLM